MANRPKQSPKRTLPIVPGAPITSVRIGPYQVLAYKRTLPAVPGSPVCIAPGVIAIPPYVDPYGGFICPTCHVTVSVVHPGTMSFVSSTYSVAEQTPGYVRVYVQRLGGSDGTSSVYYNTSNGTATTPSFYTAVSGTLSWTNGNATTQSFIVPIINGAPWVSSTTTFSASLSSPVNSALGLSKSIVSIISNGFTPGHVTFEYAVGSVLETSPSITLYVFRVSGSDGPCSASYTSSNGTAINLVNYTGSVGTFGWGNGDTAPKTFSVGIINDGVDTADLLFTASLYNFLGCLPGNIIQDLITIVDVPVSSPGTIQFTSSSYSVAENTPGYIFLDVVRTGGVSGSAAVNYTSSNGTAINPTNYTGSFGTLTWANGDAAPKSFSVGIINDGIWTSNLKFSSSLSGAIGATLGTISRSIVTIVNSTPYAPGVIAFMFPSQSIVETDADLTIYVERTGGSNGTASVQFTASNGTATNPLNYVATVGTLTWNNGQSGWKTISHTINNIPGWNPDVAFTTSLHSVTNATLGLSQNITTILNVNPYTPGYILNDQDEIFTDEAPDVEEVSTSFSRYSGSDGPASVLWGTVDGTARQGRNYVSNGGLLSWAHGESGSKWVNIALMNDGVWREALDPVYFYANQLAEPDGALPGYRISTYVFLENVNPPQRGTMSFVSPTYSVAENTPGYVRLYVTRSGGANQTASVGYVVYPGTATYPADFTYTSGILNWASGDSGSKYFDVPIINNAQWVAVNKYFTASLQNASTAIIGTVSRSIVTIINDDVPVPGRLTLTNESLYVNEDAGTIDVFVERVGGTDGAVSTDFATADGTATQPTNYTSTGGTLTWANGDSNTQHFTVTIKDDSTWNNPNLYFTAYLHTPVNTTYDLDATTIEIVDVSPGEIQLTSATYSVNESETTVTIGFARTNGSYGASSIEWAATGNTAVEDVNFVPRGGLASWADGEVGIKYDTVTIIDDGEYHVPNLFFDLTLFNNVNSTIGTISAATVTIIENIPPPPGTIEFASATYDITEPGTAVVYPFYVKRTGGSVGVSTVDFASSNITAITPTDYVGQSNTLTWANGDDADKAINMTVNYNPIVYFENITNLGALPQPWFGMAATNNGHIFAAAYGSGMYKRTGGVGEFTLVDGSRTDFYFIAASPSRTIYSTIYATEGILKSVGGTGPYVLDPAYNGIAWYSIAIDPGPLANGDVYLSSYAFVWKQAGGTGPLVAFAPPTYRGPVRQIAIQNENASGPAGDLYITIDAWAPIYVWENGGAEYTEIPGSAGGWTGIAAAPNGDVYACQNNGTIYVKKSGAPTFVEITPNQSAQWSSMVVAQNGNVYADVYNGDIYMMTELNKRFKINLSNVTNSELGSIVESVGTIVKV